MAIESVLYVIKSSESDVRFWDKADMLNALTNVRFWGLDIDKPLPTSLDL